MAEKDAKDAAGPRKKAPIRKPTLIGMAVMTEDGPIAKLRSEPPPEPAAEETEPEKPAAPEPPAPPKAKAKPPVPPPPKKKAQKPASLSGGVYSVRRPSSWKAIAAALETHKAQSVPPPAKTPAGAGARSTAQAEAPTGQDTASADVGATDAAATNTATTDTAATDTATTDTATTDTAATHAATTDTAASDAAAAEAATPDDAISKAAHADAAPSEASLEDAPVDDGAAAAPEAGRGDDVAPAATEVEAPASPAESADAQATAPQTSGDAADTVLDMRVVPPDMPTPILGTPQADRPAASNRGMLWAIAGVVLLAALAGVAVLVFGSGDDPPAADASEPPSDSPETPAPEATAASPDEAPDVASPDETSEDATEETAEAADPANEVGETDAPPSDATREEMLAFELEPPRPSRRVSRMSQADRRRRSTRAKRLALSAYRDGEHAESERLYREALTYNSWDVAAVEGLARAIAQQGRFPEARAWAQLAVDRNARSAQAYRVLGDVWNQAGFADDARNAWRRGLVLDPNDRWLRQRLSELDETP